MKPSRNFKSKETVVYTALFVDDSDALKEKYPPVHANVFYHHSTIAFKPKERKDNLNVGEKHRIAIIGRVTSEKVDVLLVNNEKSVNDNPHITLSTAEGVRPSISNAEIANAIKNGDVVAVDDSIGVIQKDILRGKLMLSNK